MSSGPTRPPWPLGTTLPFPPSYCIHSIFGLCAFIWVIMVCAWRKAYERHILAKERRAPHSWLLSRDTSGFMELRGRDNETMCALRAVERGFKEPQRRGSPSRSPGSVRMAFAPSQRSGVIRKLAVGSAPGDDGEMAPGSPMEIITV